MMRLRKVSVAVMDRALAPDPASVPACRDCAWRGGRVVECTALEMRHTREGIVGSNPTLSAIVFYPYYTIT